MLEIDDYMRALDRYIEERAKKYPEFKPTKKQYQQAQSDLRTYVADQSEKQQRQEQIGRQQAMILDCLENSAGYVEAHAEADVRQLPFVREAIDAKRSGKIARLTDYGKPKQIAMDRASDEAKVMADIDYLTANVAAVKRGV